MSDSAFKSAPFSGFTTDQLRARVAADERGETNLPDATYNGMVAEIARREAVARGDVSVMTPGERLRFIRANPA